MRLVISSIGFVGFLFLGGELRLLSTAPVLLKTTEASSRPAMTSPNGRRPAAECVRPEILRATENRPV